MKKLIATTFLAVLAAGSISGCLLDDGGYRGDGMRGEHADRQDQGQRNRMGRDEHRGADDQRMENRR